MFFGIFSSVIPYLIAAGFYLVWLLFSFVQPLLQKGPVEDSAEELIIISVEEQSPARSDLKAFEFEDFKNDTKFSSSFHFISSYFPDIPLLFRLKIHYPPDNNFCFHREVFLNGLFSRPPPAC